MKRFLHRFLSRFSIGKAAAPPVPTRSDARPPARSGKPGKAAAVRRPESVDLEDPLDGHIESLGPGKNVLVRNKYVREDTGTHETLRILDESVIDTGEDEGDDPYNSGVFDKSKNWEKARK